uniref:Genome polyprotein n=1 Tax=Lagomorph hepacivirus TaxID=3138818 RepID=A0AAU6R4T6_9FLAV
MSLVISPVTNRSQRLRVPRRKPKTFLPYRKGWQPVLLVKGPRRARGKRGRATRDYGSYLGSTRGGRIPIVDPVLGATSELLLPRSALSPGDPRRRSRNLGHIIDGALGLTSDVLAHTPLVGPLLGGLTRGLCRFVRGLEDGANWCTGKFGVVFFLLTLLTCVSPADSFRRFTPDNHSYPVAVTNCCEQADIIYCSDVFCFHKPGCVVCTDVCWEIQSAMVSYHPQHNGTDSRLASHIDTLALIALSCDILEAPEVCGVSLILIDTAFTWFPHRLNLTNTDCYLYTSVTIDPSLIGFVKWLASSYSTVTTMLATLLKIPQALVNLLADVHFGVLASVFWFGMQGAYVKVLLLLLVYVESSVAFGNSPTCTPYLAPKPCSALNWTAYSHHYCFKPEIIIGNATSPPPYGFGCVTWNFDRRIATNITCCSLRTTACNCSTDCSWLDPTQTYERCGTTPFLTTIWRPLPDNSTHGFWAIGAIIVPAWHTYLFNQYMHQWEWLKLFDGDREFYVAYNTSFRSHPPTHLARLPYRPDFYRYYTLQVPAGFYSDFKDLSTGLVSKTADGNYQLVYSATGFVNLHSIATSILICLLLALIGAKWTLLCYILYLQLSHGYAITPVLWGALSMCNTTQPYAMVRFLLGYKYRHYAAALLCPWPSNLLLAFMSMIDGVVALHECTATVVCIGLTVFCVLGMFSFLLATTLYSGWYFASVIVHFAEKVFSRNRRLTLALLILHPQLVWELAILVSVCYLLTLSVLHIAYSLLVGSNQQRLMQLLRACDGYAVEATRFLQSLLTTVGADHGCWLFSHLGSGYISALEYNDPYFPYPVQFSYYRRQASFGCCGDMIGGKPIIGTDGDVVVAGVGRLPAGFSHLAPVNLVRHSDYGYFSVFRSIVTGCSSSTSPGSVFTFTSAMTCWMGFSCNGYTYTALHGSRGRSFATPQGRMGPIYTDKELDLAMYPRIPGSTDLQACTCDASRGYVCLRDGSVRLVVKMPQAGRWAPVDRVELALARGSSGSPVLCESGHVIGMFTAVGKVLATVVNLKVSPISVVPVSFPQAHLDAVTVADPPPVPKDNLKILNVVAPTGSGKSTKLPMHYYNAGYRVLVVNPSVATTLAMDQYMASTYGVSPNILASDTTHNRASRLTYSTYGRVLAGGNLDYDVVILDECHSTDATTVLGIGSVLQKIHDTKCKLVLLATATPPGASYAPHPQIEELPMPTTGGLAISKDRHLDLTILKTGRHLVFVPTKRECDELARSLRQAGIKSISYYRGKDIGDIPVEGDVVVVATDALMTGYTGNFDSVWDSCLSVFTEVRLDLDPTFTIQRITQPSGLMTRLQRRGRTGRGSPGKYYYAAPPPASVSCVPLVSIVQAFDSGTAYFGMTPAEVGLALDTYHNTPGLPSIHAELAAWCHFFCTLGVPSPAFLNRAKANAEDFELLTARMYEELYRAGSSPPNDSPRWRGLSGKAPPFILYNLDGPSANIREWQGCEDLRKCFDEEFVSTDVVFGVGVGLFILYGVAETYGCFTVRSSFSVTFRKPEGMVGSNPAWMEVEECSDSIFSDVYSIACSKIRSWVDAGAPVGQAIEKTMDVNFGHWGNVQAFLTTHASTFLSLCQYFGGLLTLDSNPLVASAMAGAATLMSPASLGVKVFVGLLGGAVASRLTSMRSSTLFTASTIAGSLLSTFTTPGFILSLLSGYTAASHAAVCVMKVLGGTMPNGDELTGLLSGVVAPASLLAGGVLGAIAHFLTADSTNLWTNRLLSMLTRQTTCPGYFEEARDLRKTILTWLESATPWRVLNTVMDWIQREDSVPCGSSLASAVCTAAASLLRAICEFFRGSIRKLARIPGLPVVGCQSGWSGPWAGDGVLHTTCQCGAEQVWTITGGRPTLASCPWTCSSRWSRRIPINNTTTGVPKPIISTYQSFVVSAGFYRYLKYEKRGNELFCVASSSSDDEVPAGAPPLSAALMVDGVTISPNAGPCNTPWTGTVTYRGQPTQLPICVSAPVHSPRCVFEEREKEALKKPPLGSKDNPIVFEFPKRERPPLFPNAKPPELKPKGPLPPQSKDWLHKVADQLLHSKEITVKDSSKNPPPSDSGSEITLAQFPPSLPSLSTMSTATTGKPYDTSDLDESIPSTSRSGSDTETDGYDSAVDTSDTGKSESSGLTVKHRAAVALLGPRAPGTAEKALSNTEELECLEREVAKLKNKGKGVIETKFQQKIQQKLTGASQSSWETISEESCSMSYNWIPFKVSGKTVRHTSPVAVLSSTLTSTKHLAYVTRKEEITLRMAKVTQWRQHDLDDTYWKWVAYARSRARNVRAREWSLAEAIDHTPKKTAKSHITGMTGADLKGGATWVKDTITSLYNLLLTTFPDDYRTVTIMAKEEVFALTKDKPTRKPPRIIAYPPLETRVVEKMVLGDIGPKVVKAVCGKAYGFQYSPAQRVARMLEMWKMFDPPMGFSCDTVCFDSTITPEDVQVECDIYSSCQTSAATRARIKSLHDHLYASGPMRTQDGQPAGQRNCRASGVFTTSSSNTMTCFIKVCAALDRAGFSKWELLVNGDDCVIITQSKGVEVDAVMCEQFAAAMKLYGCPQDCVPTPSYSLERITSCSSNVSVAKTDAGQSVYYLTRNPTIPFARCIIEGDKFNPVGAWLGFIINHGHALWVQKILIPNLLNYLLHCDPLPTVLSFDWWGKQWSIPVSQLPEILEGLHGPSIWKVTQYTPMEVERTAIALKTLGMASLRQWRKRAREIRVKCMRRGGTLKKLALRLLWWDHSIPLLKLDQKVIKDWTTFDYFDFWAEPPDIDIGKRKSTNWVLVLPVLILSLFFFSF